MCHFTLPKHPGKRLNGNGLDGRYADDVIKMFQHEARRYGTTIQDYEAKIFGGGNMIRSEGQDIDDSIGTKNSVAAMQLLMQENVNILVAHVGEFGHRRIVFDSGTGEVWVRHIAKGAQRINSINGVI
jgi:chemotaxis protein CheD